MKRTITITTASLMLLIASGTARAQVAYQYSYPGGYRYATPAYGAYNQPTPYYYSNPGYVQPYGYGVRPGISISGSLQIFPRMSWSSGYQPYPVYRPGLLRNRLRFRFGGDDYEDYLEDRAEAYEDWYEDRFDD